MILYSQWTQEDPADRADQVSLAGKSSEPNTAQFTVTMGEYYGLSGYLKGNTFVNWSEEH